MYCDLFAIGAFVMPVFITIAKTVVSCTNILLIGMLAYFMKPLRWENMMERPSIIGFGMMMVAYLLSAVLLWF